MIIKIQGNTNGRIRTEHVSMISYVDETNDYNVYLQGYGEGFIVGENTGDRIIACMDDER